MGDRVGGTVVVRFPHWLPLELDGVTWALVLPSGLVLVFRADLGRERADE